MFWSLDKLFQVRKSNMFQMAYKYMYIVNNLFQDSRQEEGRGVSWPRGHQLRIYLNLNLDSKYLD